MAQLVLLIFVPMALATLATSQLNYTTDPLWLSFKADFNKTSYSSPAEESRHYRIFLANVDRINATNNRTLTDHLGINQFADLTFQEFEALYLGFVPSPSATLTSPSDINLASLPDSINWNAQGFVTPVKNQGECGSCWAFSATGALESQLAINEGLKYILLTSLSEQNLMDCSGQYGNNGCGGGSAAAAFEYVGANHGINTESSYPYQGKVGKCRFNSSAVGAKCTAVNYVYNTELELQNAVANVGPISVAINVTEKFKDWSSSEVFIDDTCGNDLASLAHEVLVVGYGTEGQQDYWLVKNSWGSTWGDEGYIKMARNRNNMCGIATCATYPGGVTNAAQAGANISYDGTLCILLFSVFFLF